MALQACPLPVTICRQRVANLNRLSNLPECVLANGSKVTLAPLVAAHIARGDDVSFPLPNSSTATAEILVNKNSQTGSGRDVYQAAISYLTQFHNLQDASKRASVNPAKSASGCIIW